MQLAAVILINVLLSRALSTWRLFLCLGKLWGPSRPLACGASCCTHKQAPDVLTLWCSFPFPVLQCAVFRSAFWLFMKHAFKPILLLGLIECRRELTEILTHYSVAYWLVEI